MRAKYFLSMSDRLKKSLGKFMSTQAKTRVAGGSIKPGAERNPRCQPIQKQSAAKRGRAQNLRSTNDELLSPRLAGTRQSSQPTCLELPIVCRVELSIPETPLRFARERCRNLPKYRSGNRRT